MAIQIGPWETRSSLLGTTLLAQYSLRYQTVVYQLRLHQTQRPEEEDHLLDRTVGVEAERMASTDVVTLDMGEGEEEAGDLMTGETTEDLVEVYHRGNGEEAKHHQTATLALEGDEGEETAVTGVVEEEGGGSRIGVLQTSSEYCVIPRPGSQP